MEDVFALLLEDKEFYSRSKGGVTLSGGEPGLYPEFVASLLSLCRNAGIHTCVETNGSPAWPNYMAFLDQTDLFLFDYKMTDPEAHLRWTGAPLEPILRNLEALLNARKKVILRCPVIPGVNDVDSHLEGIARLVLKFDLTCEVLPFHGTAKDKWSALGLVNEFASTPSMTEEAAEEIVGRIKAFGVPPDSVIIP